MNTKRTRLAPETRRRRRRLPLAVAATLTTLALTASMLEPIA